ncbi:MAG: hypothetical protein K1X29_05985 [Bdellovibrionales bacterium]|nr:hypothetical protein [Bdellovibrionales bacterium]
MLKECLKFVLILNFVLSGLFIPGGNLYADGARCRSLLEKLGPHLNPEAVEDAKLLLPNIIQQLAAARNEQGIEPRVETTQTVMMLNLIRLLALGMETEAFALVYPVFYEVKQIVSEMREIVDWLNSIDSTAEGAKTRLKPFVKKKKRLLELIQRLGLVVENYVVVRSVLDSVAKGHGLSDTSLTRHYAPTDTLTSGAASSFNAPAAVVAPNLVLKSEVTADCANNVLAKLERVLGLEGLGLDDGDGGIRTFAQTHPIASLSSAQQMLKDVTSANNGWLKIFYSIIEVYIVPANWFKRYPLMDQFTQVVLKVFVGLARDQWAQQQFLGYIVSLIVAINRVDSDGNLTYVTNPQFVDAIINQLLAMNAIGGQGELFLLLFRIPELAQVSQFFHQAIIKKAEAEGSGGGVYTNILGELKAAIARAKHLPPVSLSGNISNHYLIRFILMHLIILIIVEFLMGPVGPRDALEVLQKMTVQVLTSITI